MIDFVGTSPFLRIALWVAMETMHFHIAPKNLYWGTIFRIAVVPMNNMALIRNCPVVMQCKVGQISFRGIAKVNGGVVLLDSDLTVQSEALIGLCIFKGFDIEWRARRIG